MRRERFILEKHEPSCFRKCLPLRIVREVNQFRSQNANIFDSTRLRWRVERYNPDLKQEIVMALS